MKRTFIITLILMLATIGQIYVDIYSSSLPHIVTSLQTSASLVKLTISAFLIAFGLGQFIFGLLSDTYGRKSLLIIGTFICMLASIAASVAHSIEFLLLARFFQGLGVGAAASIYRPIMTDNFHDLQELAKVSALMSLAWTLVPIFAPVLGSYIQHYFGWRYNFVILSVYSAACILLIIFKFKDNAVTRIPFNFPTVAGNLKILMTSKLFVPGIICQMSLYAVVITFAVLGPFIIQNTLKYSAIGFGHSALVVGACLAVGSILNRKLLNKFSPQAIYNMASYILLCTAVVFLVLSLFMPLNIYTLLIPICLISLLLTLIGSNVLSTIIAKYKHIAGISSALIGLVMFGSAAFFTAIESNLKNLTLVTFALIYLIGTAVAFISTKFTLKNS